jgi:hypothetical protein
MLLSQVVWTAPGVASAKQLFGLGRMPSVAKPASESFQSR